MEELINTVFGPMYALKTDARIGQELKIKGCWDLNEILDTIRFFERYSQSDNGFILDVGCNIGAWAMPVARRYPDFQIVGFDCQEYLINCLNKTIDLNKILNVQTQLMAISDTVGEIKFGSVDYTFGGNFGAFELEAPTRNSDFNGTVLPGQFTTIEQRTVDSFNFDQVALIKIDVEGMEYKVIKGAINTLQRCKSVVLFESHKCDYSAVIKLLESIDYRVVGTVGQMSCAISTK